MNLIKKLYFSGLCMSLLVAAQVQTDDVVKLLGGSEGNDSIVLIYGKSGDGCIPNQFFHGRGVVNVGNFQRPTSDCPSDIAVFSAESGFSFTENVAGWSDSPGDEIEVSLGPRVQIPVQVGVLGGPFGARKKFIEADFTRANEIYNESRCGLRFAFVPSAIKDLTGAVVKDERLANISSCSGLSAFSDMHWINRDALNVFYMDMAGSPGLWCPDDNTVLISLTADGETLAHELGHALLGADHADGILDDDNIMTTFQDRNGITAGQCFRANLSDSSRLVTLNNLASTRNCPPVKASKKCPTLAFDPLK